MASPLASLLAARIAREGPLTFREFMREALLHPEHGYYARGPAIGAAGDFYTSASFPAFARALARQARDAFERLGKPADFRVVEVGGGTGELAERTRAELSDVRYVVVEPAPGLAVAQRARGLDVVPSLDALAPGPTLLVANEVLDALPVHRVVMRETGLRELYVDIEDGRLVAREGRPSTPALAAHLAARGLVLRPGEACEVNLDARGFVAEVAGVLDPGFAILVDYGEERPPPRPTLATYRRHRMGEDPLEEPGERDITADVDFGAVRAFAEAAGCRVAPLTTQGRFLAALGVLEEALRSEDPLEVQRAKTLVVPGGMGDRFKVLVAAKGVAPDLAGLRAPW